MLKQLKVMFELQNKLNNNTNGIDWRTGVTKDGKKINWYRCIYMESAEFIDSFQWKHWKNINCEPDIKNAKVELIDIWHFILSEMLLDGLIDSKTDALYNYVIVPTYERATPYEHQDDIFSIMELIINEATKPKPKIHMIAKNFFTACAQLELSFNDLYKGYVGKNVLNQFRQDNGYKEGTYKKLWNGKEDNVIMMELLNKAPSTTPEKLYEKLNKKYLSLKTV